MLSASLLVSGPDSQSSTFSVTGGTESKLNSEGKLLVLKNICTFVLTKYPF